MDRASWGVALFIVIVLGTLFHVLDLHPRLVRRLSTALIVGTALLWAGVRILLWALARSGRRGPFPLRQGLANVHRPGNQTAIVVITLGLGTALLVSTLRFREVLIDAFGENLPDQAPNVFVIDVQDDQIKAVVDQLQEIGYPPTETVPLVRSQIVSLDGETVVQRHPDPRDRPWYLRRDYVLTFRDRLSVSETVVEGRFWGGGRVGAPEVSVERKTARRLGLTVGSTITLAIQGIEVEASVTSIREVRWSTLRPNFFMVMPEEAIGKAPRTWFVVCRVPDAEGRGVLQRRLVEAHPNLTIIDITVAVDILDKLFDRLVWCVTLITILLVLGGSLVLFGSILMTRHHRTREMVLLKCMGASERTLQATLAVEYLTLGLMGSVLGAVGGELLIRYLGDRILEITVVTDASLVLGAAVIGGGVTVLVGTLASRGVLSQPPASVLRAP